MGTKRHAILLIGALLLSHQGFAAEFTVDSTEDAVDISPGDGVCATVAGQCTLRAAIQETNALNGVDTVNLPSGTYRLTIAGPQEPSSGGDISFVAEVGDLDVTDSMNLIGEGAGTTAIDGFGEGRVLHIAPNATVELSGVRIQGGIDSPGGGVFNAGTLTMRHCVITGNLASWFVSAVHTSGGGVFNEGSLTLIETVLAGNSAESFGGGISNTGSATITDSAVLANRADRFGLTTFLIVSGVGGGIKNEGSMSLTRVTVARNTLGIGAPLVGSPAGSGIANFGALTISNSTISDNNPLALGVGEVNNEGLIEVNNATIGAHGIATMIPSTPPVPSSEGTMRLQNTLIEGPCTGTIQSLGHNLIADATGCTLLGDGTGNLIGVDPRLGALQDNGGSTETRALLPGSPAIDAGDEATCQATDQRGISRPLDGDLDGLAICDIGAYEADGSEQETGLAAAVLPGSRLVLVGSPATAFATILNSGPVTATECTIASTTNVPANFLYQTTDPMTNELTGTPNTAADIEPGAGQTFLVAFIPNSEFFEEVVRLQFACTNAAPAPVIVGVNTLLVSASTSPIPDIVAANATIKNDGIVTIPGETGSGVFAVATVNVGAAGPITVSADTGNVTLPVNVSVCETNPNTSVCLAEPGPEVTTTIGSNATPTFGVFVVGEGTVPFDPANNRIFVRFEEFGSTRGLTSVAVTTAP